MVSRVYSYFEQVSNINRVVVVVLYLLYDPLLDKSYRHRLSAVSKQKLIQHKKYTKTEKLNVNDIRAFDDDKLKSSKVKSSTHPMFQFSNPKMVNQLNKYHEFARKWRNSTQIISS